MGSKGWFCFLTSCLLAQPASAQDWNWGDEPWDDLLDSRPSLYAAAVAGAQLSDGGAGAFDHNAGYVAGGQFGIVLKPWRVESEITYQRTDYDDAVDLTFDLEVIRGTIGLYYDVKPIAALGGISPYAGGGLGAASLEVSGTDGNGFKDDTISFTLHGETGINLSLTDQIAVAPHYRFEWFDSGGETAGANDDFYAHALRVSLRVFF